MKDVSLLMTCLDDAAAGDVSQEGTLIHLPSQ
jgi:hypothetical protein